MEQLEPRYCMSSLLGVSAPIDLSGLGDFRVGANGISSGNGTAQAPYVIQNLYIDGAGSAQAAINVRNSGGSHLLIQNVTVRGGASGISVENSPFVTVRDVTISDTHQGIRILGSHHVAIDRATITDTVSSGIIADHATNSTYQRQVSQISVTNSLIQSTGVLGEAAIQLFGEGNLIQGNTIEHSRDRGISIFGPFRNTLIRNNHFEDILLEGVLVYGPVPATVKTAAATQENCQGITITGNYFTGLHEDGIELWKGVGPSVVSNNTFVDNLVADSPFNPGSMNMIEIIEHTYGVAVFGNTIVRSGGDPQRQANGILLAGSHHVTVANNRIDGVPGYGIEIMYLTTAAPLTASNLIEGNVVTNAGWGEIGFRNAVNDLNLLYLNVIRQGPLLPGSQFYVTGAREGNWPRVRAFDADSGYMRHEFSAYRVGFRGGVRVASGDVNGDQIPDVITAPGPGHAPDVRVFDGRTGAMIRSFFAYQPFFNGGVHVATADMNADGYDDVITSPGPGHGPDVRVFDGRTGTMIGSFFAYQPSFLGGVSVASGDVNRDGRNDLITSPLKDHAPDVRVFDHSTGRMIRSFFAYQPHFRGGVYVASGDFNADGFDEIVTSPRQGHAPDVRIFDGETNRLICSFFAYYPHFLGGASVGVTDLNQDGVDDLLTAPGIGYPPRVRGYDGKTLVASRSFLDYGPFMTESVSVSGSL